MNFSNTLHINFTFEFPSCKCFRLHIMTRYKLFYGNFCTKRNLYFYIEHFIERLSNFMSFSEKFNFIFISDLELPGSGMIFSGFVSGSY
jgi:hypothetical protein